MPREESFHEEIDRRSRIRRFRDRSLRTDPGLDHDADHHTTQKKKVVAAVPAPTEQEIADARAKGMVWVNTSAKLYHHQESKYYGKTKQGKFMTEDDAKAAGFMPAKVAAAKKKAEAAK